MSCNLGCHIIRYHFQEMGVTSAACTVPSDHHVQKKESDKKGVCILVIVSDDPYDIVSI